MGAARGGVACRPAISKYAGRPGSRGSASLNLSGKASDGLHQLLFGRKLSETGQTLARQFDIGPPHDSVTADQELPLELGDAAFDFFVIGLSPREAVELVERLGGRRNGQWLGQLAGRVASRILDRFPQLRRRWRVRQSVGAVGVELRVCGQWRAGWSKPEVEARVVRGRRDDGQCLDTGGLELVGHRAELGDRAPAERTVEP